jgi:hypothetical protein
VHRRYVERLVQDEAAALQQLVHDDIIVRLECRGTDLVAELHRGTYDRASAGGYTVPLLGQRRASSIVLVLHCDNYDSDPPSVTFVTDWTASDDMSYADWPKGPGIVERHYATGKPFVCRPGVREYHSHIQHGDQPWDKLRGFIRPRELMRDLARDLLDKNVFA